MLIYILNILNIVLINVKTPSSSYNIQSIKPIFNLQTQSINIDIKNNIILSLIENIHNYIDN